MVGAGRTGGGTSAGRSQPSCMALRLSWCWELRLSWCWELRLSWCWELRLGFGGAEVRQRWRLAGRPQCSIGHDSEGVSQKTKSPAAHACSMVLPSIAETRIQHLVSCSIQYCTVIGFGVVVLTVCRATSGTVVEFPSISRRSGFDGGSRGVRFLSSSGHPTPIDLAWYISGRHVRRFQGLPAHARERRGRRMREFSAGVGATVQVP